MGSTPNPFGAGEYPVSFDDAWPAGAGTAVGEVLDDVPGVAVEFGDDEGRGS